MSLILRTVSKPGLGQLVTPFRIREIVRHASVAPKKAGGGGGKAGGAKAKKVLEVETVRIFAIFGSVHAAAIQLALKLLKGRHVPELKASCLQKYLALVEVFPSLTTYFYFCPLKSVTFIARLFCLGGIAQK